MNLPYLLFTMIFLFACGEEKSQQTRTQVVDSGSLDQKPNDDGDAKEQDEDDDPKTKRRKRGSADERAQRKDNEKGGADGNQQTLSGPDYFDQVILDVIAENNCAECHADPRMDPPIQGPLSIFNYDAMHTLLDQGLLFDKVMNITSHGGGDQCDGSIDNSPCQEFLGWWDAEFGSLPERAADRPVKLFGEIRLVSDVGTFTGWGYDPARPDEAITIKVYLGGDRNGGNLVGETQANLAGFDNNLDGSHAYQMRLDEQLIDNQEKTATVYGVIGGEEMELKGSPITFTAYKKSAEGRAFYDNNVRGRLGGCTGCHTFDYDTHWPTLLSPSPAKGGTAESNILFRKVSGGVQHAGGTFCGGGNGSPCNEFRQWWQIEFGN